MPAPTLVGFGQPIWAVEPSILQMETAPAFSSWSLQPAACPGNPCCTVPPTATGRRGPSLGSPAARDAAHAHVLLQRAKEALPAFMAVKLRAPRTSRKRWVFYGTCLFVMWKVTLLSVAFLFWFCKCVWLRPNLQVDAVSGWRFCWVGVGTELVTTGSSGTAEGMVVFLDPKGTHHPPNTRQKSEDTLCLWTDPWKMKPALDMPCSRLFGCSIWSEVVLRVLPSHLQLPCPLNIFTAKKWGKKWKWNTYRYAVGRLERSLCCCSGLTLLRSLGKKPKWFWRLCKMPLSADGNWE